MRRLTREDVLEAVEAWIALCRDLEAFETGYQRRTGEAFDLVAWNALLDRAYERADPRARRVLEMALEVGRAKAAEELRRELEAFLDETARASEPPRALRPVLVVDNTARGRAAGARERAAAGAAGRSG